MGKKLIGIAIIAIMLFGVFGLAGCGSGLKVDSFNSLIEMQESLRGKTLMQEDFFYFSFDETEVVESGRYEATKKKRSDDDTEYVYYRYSIWYKVTYEFDAKTKEKSLLLIATAITRPISSIKNTQGIFFVKFLDEGHNHSYYFWIENSKDALTENEKTYLRSICEQAVGNKYQFSADK